MIVWLQGMLWLMVILSSPACIEPSGTKNLFPEITDQRFIDDCVREHNIHRSTVNPAASNMRYMTWDEALAITARAWARKCDFTHNIYLNQPKKLHPNATSVGENIWAAAPPSMFTVQAALKSWVDEVQDYDYYSNNCRLVCGHYTQVVWGDSYRVGCAVQVCPGGVTSTTFSHLNGVIFLCNYATAGNWAGQHPYKTGPSCGDCGEERCQDNLCHDPNRDQLKRYRWSPAWDPAASSCGSFCIAVLIIRPVGVVVTFASVYILKTIYPNMFAYE